MKLLRKKQAAVCYFRNAFISTTYAALHLTIVWGNQSHMAKESTWMTKILGIRFQCLHFSVRQNSNISTARSSRINWEVSIFSICAHHEVTLKANIGQCLVVWLHIWKTNWVAFFGRLSLYGWTDVKIGCRAVCSNLRRSIFWLSER